MNFVFILEEPSSKAMLQGLLPRLLPENFNVQYIVYEGKQALLKRLHIKLRAWRAPNTYFIILFDKDLNDCVELKKQVQDICVSSGRPDALIRIACHELESWYLGDLKSVEQALEIPGLSNKQKSKFPKPDDLADPKGDLKRLTKNSYQQIDGSRKIGKILPATGNRSTSFGVFVSGLKKLTTQAEACVQNNA